MNKKPDNPDPLRAAAEAELAHLRVEASQVRPAEELLHELQVHQIELEMQNEELRRAQLALEESRDRYVELYEFAPVGYITLTRDGMISEINLTGAKLLDVERKKLLRRRFDSFVVPDQQNHWNRLFAGTLQSSETTICELTLKTATGERIYANLNCKRHENDGEPPVVRITLGNITKHKQTEDRLLDSEKKFSLIFDKSAIAIALSRLPNGEFVDVNEAWVKLFGYAKEEVIGKTTLELGINSDCASRASLMAELQQQGSVRNVELTLMTKHGGERIFLVNADMIDMDGKKYAITTKKDITGRKAYEQQLRELTAHLQTVREEEKASIAREIHDDLGGTLTAIKMEACWLAEELSASKVTEPLLKHVALISQLTDNAVNVTRRVITGLRPTILDDLGLLAALEWQAGQFHMNTGIACRVNSIGDKAELDKPCSIALFRIFQESLTNVARHSGATRVEVEFHSSDEGFMLSVSDDGRGLPDGHTISPTSFGVRGMCERVEQLGGKIKFDSPPGGGFNVTVTLPPPAETTKESKA